MKNFFKNKDILVTGSCGSIGTEIVRQLLKFNVKRIRAFDHNECGQFNLEEQMEANPKLRILIGDIRNKDRLRMAMKGVDIVFHAAALKHVPLSEYNPFEAVTTNVYGTQNLIDVAREENVDRFIGISTDKAVNPINTMGATKLLSEKITMNASLGDFKTKFSCVRFGNVLNSNGSVIPLFKEQIRKGTVKVTSKDMIRFFLSLKEAVNLILKSAMIMKGREIFILKMKALKIMDLAEVMVEESNTNYNIKIQITNIRSGEKLYEMLMTDEESKHVILKDNMFILKPDIFTPHVIRENHISKPISKECYDAREAKLLTKDEIRKLLYKEGIL